jgi:hypothetical protein
MWFIYTAILISSIVYYNLSTVECPTNPETAQQQHQEYIEQQEAKIQQQQQ